MSRYYHLFLMILLILLIACNENENDNNIKKDFEAEINGKKKILSDSLKKVRKNEIALKYGASTKWERKTKYTYQLDSIIKSENKPILFEGRIGDIIKEGEDYIISLLSTGNSESNTVYILAKITLDSSRSKIVEKLASEKVNKFNFILRVNKVSSKYPSLIIDSGKEDLDFDVYSKITLLYCELIDFNN